MGTSKNHACHPEPFAITVILSEAKNLLVLRVNSVKDLFDNKVDLKHSEE